MYENVRPMLNHWIVQNADQHEQCSSVPKQKRAINTKLAVPRVMHG